MGDETSHHRLDAIDHTDEAANSIDETAQHEAVKNMEAEKDGQLEKEMGAKESAKILSIKEQLKLSSKERGAQRLLVSKWHQGQVVKEDPNLDKQQTIVSRTKNYQDLKRDVGLLSTSQELPEKHRIQMEERRVLIEHLAPMLKNIPNGKALFFIISSATPSVHEAIPSAISEKYFDILRKNIERSSLSPSSNDISEWEAAKRHKFPGKKFFISHDDGRRMHITLIDEQGYPAEARFEIGRADPNQKITFSSANYFQDTQYKKYGNPEEAGKRLMQSSNEWIAQQRPNLEKYYQLSEKVKVKGLQMPHYEKAGIEKALEFIISILKYGKTKYTHGRDLTPETFLTDHEDALVMVRDLKFDTYNVFRPNIIKLQKLAESEGLAEVAKGIAFFLNDDI